jgi:hypothetical protein
VTVLFHLFYGINHLIRPPEYLHDINLVLLTFATIIM